MMHLSLDQHHPSLKKDEEEIDTIYQGTESVPYIRHSLSVERGSLHLQ